MSTDAAGQAAYETDGTGLEPEPTPEPEHRDVSDLREVRDGGFGWGSAAPLADGAMPLGHPVKASRQWMKYRNPGDPWYDQITADVWFVDAATAERAGFSHN